MRGDVPGKYMNHCVGVNIGTILKTLLKLSSTCLQYRPWYASIFMGVCVYVYVCVCVCVGTRFMLTAHAWLETQSNDFHFYSSTYCNPLSCRKCGLTSND